MKKLKNLVIVLVALLVLAAAVQGVVAETTGINLVALVQQKASSLVDSDTASVSSQLEKTKQDTMTDTLNYIDTYISDINNSLADYTAQQTDAAKLKITSKEQDVKTALEAQKQGAIDDSKVKIKAKIDDATNAQIADMESQLNIKIQEKFK